MVVAYPRHLSPYDRTGGRTLNANLKRILYANSGYNMTEKKREVHCSGIEKTSSGKSFGIFGTVGDSRA